MAAVMRTGQTEFLPEVTDEMLVTAVAHADVDDPDQTLEVLRELRLTSTITVPLRTRHEVIGAMQFVSAESGRRYTAEDVALATATAGRVADGLNNIWLAEQHRRISVTLQAALLPRGCPRSPMPPWPSATGPPGRSPTWAATSTTCSRSGESRWGLVIGDVCGTGPDAASLTGLARHTIRAAVRHGIDADETLSWLNEAVLTSNRDLFCTAVVATLERNGDRGRSPRPAAGTRSPSWCGRAGRSPPWARRAGCWGCSPRPRAPPTRWSCDRAMRSVLYTDGVTDLPPPYGLSEAEVQRVVAQATAGAADADEIAEHLHAELESRRPIDLRTDDTAVVIIRLDPGD